MELNTTTSIVGGFYIPYDDPFTYSDEEPVSVYEVEPLMYDLMYPEGRGQYIRNIPIGSKFLCLYKVPSEEFGFELGDGLCERVDNRVYYSGCFIDLDKGREFDLVDHWSQRLKGTFDKCATLFNKGEIDQIKFNIETPFRLVPEHVINEVKKSVFSSKEMVRYEQARRKYLKKTGSEDSMFNLDVFYVLN